MGRYASTILADLDSHEAAGHHWNAEDHHRYEARLAELITELTEACEAGRDDT